MVKLNKKILLLKFVGIFLIIVPFFFNQYSLLRALSVWVGIILILVGIFFNKKKNIIKILILLIIFISVFFGIDFILAKYLNRVPIMSYEIKSSDKVATYNSLFYRMYDCNGDRVFDIFYNKKYACPIKLEEEIINSLLSNIANNFNKYHNKFVNVNGKISGIEGSTSIVMQTYEIAENSMNGQVNFSNNITLKIMNNGNLEKVEDLKIYDTINVIGRIDKINDNGQTKEIIMEDAVITSRNDFTKYEISIIENKSCEADLKLMSKTENYTYFSHCLDAIYVKYDNENIYDLSYVLTDKRMTFDMLIKNINKEENEENIAELYKLDEFNIIKCKNSNNVVVGNKKLNLKKNYCDSFENIENLEEFEGV